MARSLEAATLSSSIRTIQALLNAGALVKGRELLQKATLDGRTDVVAYLLDEGATIDEIPHNPDITEYHRERVVMNPLCYAAYRGQPAVVKLLFERARTLILETQKVGLRWSSRRWRETSPALLF
jgi:hypothetical protein